MLFKIAIHVLITLYSAYLRGFYKKLLKIKVRYCQICRDEQSYATMSAIASPLEVLLVVLLIAPVSSIDCRPFSASTSFNKVVL